MKAFVLAAGLGTRLQSHTQNLPKVMVEVAGEKLLERNIRLLREAGISEVVINLHYLPEVIKSYFGNGKKFGVNIEYSYEPKILGTAGGVKKKQDLFSEEFLVVYGDNIFNMDLVKFITVTSEYKDGACIALFHRHKNPNSGAAGGVAEVDASGFIKAFWEGTQRPDVPYVNTGLYKLSPKIFEHIPPNTFYDFGKGLFPDLLRKNITLKAYMLDESEAVFGVDSEEYLKIAENYLRIKT